MQDLELSCAWIAKGPGTKAYMTGLVDTGIYGNIKAEDQPMIIWRNSLGTSDIYVVNGNYMGSTIGIGLLSAFEFGSSDLQLYPVADAQCMTIAGFQAFTPENEEVIQQIYTRDSCKVLQDIVWPGTVSIALNADSTMTAMMTSMVGTGAGLAADGLATDGLPAPDPDDLVSIMKMLRENRTEAGIYVSQGDIGTAQEKLEMDHQFFTGNLPDYAFQAAYIGGQDPDRAAQALAGAGFDDIRTMVTVFREDDPVLGICGSGAAVLATVNPGDSHMYSEDLRERALETALGYSMITEDLSHVLYPETPEDQWQVVSKDFARFTSGFFKQYDAFSEVSVSEAGRKVSRYLALQASGGWSGTRNGDVLTVRTADPSVPFILRLHGEVPERYDGCSIEEIDDDSYLIYLEAADSTEQEDGGLPATEATIVLGKRFRARIVEQGGMDP